MIEQKKKLLCETLQQSKTKLSVNEHQKKEIKHTSVLFATDIHQGTRREMMTGQEECLYLHLDTYVCVCE